MRVIFAETAAEAARAPNDVTVVAVGPEAELQFQRIGRDHLRLSSFVSDEEFEAWGHELFGVADELAAAVKRAAERALAGDPIPDPGIGTSQWYQLKIMLDALTLRARAVRRVVEALGPDQIVVFRREGSARVSDLPGLEGSLWTAVAGAAAPEVRISSVAAAREPLGSSARELSGRLRNATRMVGVAVAQRLTRRAPGTPAPATRRASTIVLLDRSYSLPEIETSLVASGHQVLAWPGGRTVVDVRTGATVAQLRPSPPHDEAALWREVAAEPGVRAAFAVSEIDLWSAAAPRLRQLLAAETLAFLEGHRGAAELIAQVDPDVLLSSWSEFSRAIGISAAARDAGVPFVLSRHGELGTRTNPHSARHDLDAADWVLAWGEWEQAWITRHAQRPPRTVRVGSPMVEAAVRRAPDRTTARRKMRLRGSEPVVLYAPTALSGNWWYASWRTPPDASYFAQQKALVDAVLGAGAQLVVKQHPWTSSSSPLDVFVRRHSRGRRLRLVRHPPFHHLVHMADAIVLDMPSTTLVQSLMGSSHIYVVDHPVLVWEDGVLDHLRAHGVSVCASVAALREALSADLTSGRLRQPAQRSPAAFAPLAWPGGPNEPATAAERAAAAVADIAANRRHGNRTVGAEKDHIRSRAC